MFGFGEPIEQQAQFRCSAGGAGAEQSGAGGAGESGSHEITPGGMP